MQLTQNFLSASYLDKDMNELNADGLKLKYYLLLKVFLSAS